MMTTTAAAKASTLPAGWLLVGLVALPLFGEEKATPVPLTRAHAHNDYEHKLPLLDALEHGFSGVEADIYLVGGKLLVAHDAIDLRPARTLEGLYLDPLEKRVKENGGRVYPNGPGFLLLIDIKSDGEKTYGVLRRVLAKYAGMLTVVREGVEEKRAVTVVLSGDRPRAALTAEKERLAGYDGRLEDLDAKDAPHLLPLISDNWGKHFQWRGEGPFPEAERKKLQEIVKKAHEKGRGVRLWATPEKPAVWTVLYEAGVDLINTDDLKGLRDFLLERKKTEKPN